MKLKTFLIAAGLTLGVITGAMAQRATQDSIRVRIVKNENGVLTDIDTTIAAAQHDQLLVWLSSKGIEMPPPPPLEGDSMRMHHAMIIQIDSIGGERIMRMPLPPPPPGAPLPPDAPMPPGRIVMRAPAPPPAHEGDMIVIVYDSTMQGKECRKVIITENIEGPKRPPAPKKEMKERKEIKSNELVVYPNPSNGRVTLDINMPGKGKTDLLITDMNGKTVHAEQLPETDGKISNEIDLSKNGKGIYSVRVCKGGKVIIEQIVVE